MRILSIGNFTTGWDGSICDEVHIADALVLLGHEVVRYQREEARHAILVGFEPDFILLAQWDGYPEAFMDRLQNYKCPIVYWAFDYQADGQWWHEGLVKGSDLYLSKRIADSQYANWHWLPQDFAPEFLGEVRFQRLEKDIDVLFTGSWLSWAKERTEVLKAIDKEFNLVVHSVTPDAWKREGLKNVEGPVLDHGLPGLISRTKVNISIDHTIEAGYWSDRNAQTMACGGFVLSRWVPMSEIVFGNKIAYFYGVEDCIQKIRMYLNDDFKRNHMATIGRAYATQNLMVTNRVEELLTIVGSRL